MKILHGRTIYTVNILSTILLAELHIKYVFVIWMEEKCRNYYNDKYIFKTFLFTK